MSRYGLQLSLHASKHFMKQALQRNNILGMSFVEKVLDFTKLGFTLYAIGDKDCYLIFTLDELLQAIESQGELKLKHQTKIS